MIQTLQRDGGASISREFAVGPDRKSAVIIESAREPRLRAHFQESLKAGGIRPIDLTRTTQASQTLEESVPGGAVPATLATREKKRNLGFPSLLY